MWQVTIIDAAGTEHVMPVQHETLTSAYAYSFASEMTVPHMVSITEWRIDDIRRKAYRATPTKVVGYIRYV